MARRPLAAFGLAAALALTACSASGPDSADSATTTTDADGSGTTTTADSGVTTTSTVDDDTEALDALVAESVDATFDLERITADSYADLNAGSDSVTLELRAAVDYGSRIVDAEMMVSATGADDQRLRLIGDGSNLWISPEGIGGVTTPPGKHWIEGPATALDSANFQSPGLIGTILVLRAASETTVENESEEIDGADTTVYRTTMTYDEALEAAGDDAEILQNALSLTYSEPVVIEATVWIDGDGVIRRLHLDIDPDDDTPLAGSYDLDVGRPDSVTAPEPPVADVRLTGPQAERLFGQLTAT